jgi:adenine-specific DNA-methyltransferase
MGVCAFRWRGLFDPNTGDIRSNDTDAIAAWFIDTDYAEEDFFVRHAYFLGAQDPYKNLKTALKAEIDEEACRTKVCKSSLKSRR